MRLHPGETIYEGDAIAQLVRNGRPGGDQISWQTIGVYHVDVEHRWIREVWLIPLELAIRSSRVLEFAGDLPPSTTGEVQAVIGTIPG